MSKPTTHVLMVTDMSGSMGPLVEDVRGGFNSYVAELRKDDAAKYRLTVTLFDTEFIPLCVSAKLKDVPELTRDNYRARGMTALIDAVGKTVAEFDAKTPTLADGDRVLVVVQTDGQENASREFRTEQVAELIKAREATGKWSFVFLGAGPDAWAQASGMGFAAAQTVQTQHSSAGYSGTYAAAAGASRSFARGASGADAAEIFRDGQPEES